MVIHKTVVEPTFDIEGLTSHEMRTIERALGLSNPHKLADAVIAKYGRQKNNGAILSSVWAPINNATTGK